MTRTTRWQAGQVRSFRQVDVFSDVLGLGNPVAVVHDADDLDDEQLAAFARWTNLSETTFLLSPTSPDADYRVRIFTTDRELPFAGHPTLGSARAWLDAGGQPRAAIATKDTADHPADATADVPADVPAEVTADVPAEVTADGSTVTGDGGRTDSDTRGGDIEAGSGNTSRRPPGGSVVVQECGVGLVPVRVDGTRLAFRAPPLRRGGPVDPVDVGLLTAACGLHDDDVVDAQWCDNGPGWVALLLRDAATVLRAKPDGRALGRFRDLGLVGPHPPGGEAAFEVRAFVAEPDIWEDPVTGSLNAALGQWLIAAGRAPSSYVAAQGTVLRRRGRIHVEQVDDAVWVGGDTVVGVRGEVAM